DLFLPKEESSKNTEDLFLPKEESSKNTEDLFLPKEESSKNTEDLFFPKEGPSNTADDIFFKKEEPSNTADDIFFKKEEPSNNLDDIFSLKEDAQKNNNEINTPINNDNSTNTIKEQNMNNFERKKSKTPIIIIGIVGVIAFIVIGFFIFGIGKYLNIGFGTKNIEVNKMSMKYDRTWILNTSKSSSDNIVIYKDRNVISLVYSKTSTYISTYNFALTMINENKKNGYSADSNIEDIIINGLTWKSITYTNATNKYQQLFYSTGYEMYSFIYASNKESFEKGEIEANKIMNTLTYDKTENQKGEEEAKKTLIGEWDWGISGYFVITNNKIYLYKDSTKNMNNVMIGNYTANNKIPTNTKGYVDGIHVIFTIDKVYMDGIDQNAKPFDREYTFTKNTDGTYTIWNITSDFSEVAKKIK
ncbi:MAG: hypothetical protein IKE70_06340, partial [Bacilli bacterium]|nr:hypothetical protein [Bacilli bacterium]